MKITIDYSELDDLLEQLGAPLQPFVPPEIKKKLVGPGITVKPDEFEVASDGTLEYQGLKVILYIRDVRGSLPKYHVVDCSRLKGMRNAGKHERYVVTRRTDGEFLLNFAGNLSRAEPETHRLDICKHCLGKLKLKDVYTPDAFPLADWLNAFDPGHEPPPTDGLYGPRTTPVTGPTSNYPPNWPLLSFQCREEAGWKCEECSIDLGLNHNRKFLHAHHVEGLEHNQPEDLKALCIGCHAEERWHRQVRNLPEYPEFMSKYGHIWKQARKRLRTS